MGQSIFGYSNNSLTQKHSHHGLPKYRISQTRITGLKSFGRNTISIKRTCNLYENLRKQKINIGTILKIDMLGNYLVLLDDYNNAWMFTEKNNSWERLNVGFKVIDISCNEISGFLITDKNEVYAVAEQNSWGQLGIGQKTSVNFGERYKVESDELFSEVYGGYGHTYFVSLNRILYGSGNNGYGQLCKSIGSNTNSYTPIVIDEISHERVKLMASGYAYCVVIMESGNNYVFGINDHSQLGYSDYTTIATPKPIPLDAETINSIIKIEATQQFCLLLTKQMKLYISGSFSKDIKTQSFTELKDLIKIPSTVVNFSVKYNTLMLILENSIIVEDSFGRMTISNTDKRISDLLSSKNAKLSLTCAPYSSTCYAYSFLIQYDISSHFFYSFHDCKSDVDVFTQ
ncbi:hypothetical protein ABK040_001727 [Willaertia magna]